MKWRHDTPVDRLPPRSQVDLLRQAVAARPDSSELTIALAGALARDQRFAEAADAFRRAGTLEPSSAAWTGLGSALAATGDYASAADAFSAALALAPESKEALAGSVAALRRLDRRAAALDAALALCGRPPVAPDVLEFLAMELIEAGRIAELLQRLDALIEADPQATETWYYRAIALAALCRRADAAAIMDARFVRVIDVTPADVTLDAFNAGLRTEILANQSTWYEPVHRAARKAYRARALLAGNPPTLTALGDLVRREFEGYAAACAALRCPVAAPADGARLRMWATVFGAEGHELRHIHARSCLSAVYYVAAPAAPAAPDASRAGVLRVPATARPGAADGEDWPVLDIEPRPGRLVMFPSYFPHSTVPTGIDELRISVAFDVVPATIAAEMPA